MKPADAGAAAPRTPATLLTGFLGSGKTTLLNRALRDASMAGSMVVVNEFGAVGIDHDLIEHSRDAVVLLPNGCLCCAVRSDLAATLARMDARNAGATGPCFDRVLIETSGLAEPSRLVDLFQSDPRLRGRFRLQGIVATLDAVNGPATLDTHDLARRQIALADRVCITKADLIDASVRAAALSALRARVQHIAPGADAAAVDAAAPWLRFDGDVQPRAQRVLDEIGPQAADHADARIRRFHVVSETPMAPATLELFLDALERAAGPRLLRVKGLIHVAGHPERPALVHGAQQLIHRLAWRDGWPGDDRRTRIVLLTMDMPDEEILGLLAAAQRLAGAVPAARSPSARPSAGSADHA